MRFAHGKFELPLDCGSSFGFVISLSKREQFIFLIVVAITCFSTYGSIALGKQQIFNQFYEKKKLSCVSKEHSRAYEVEACGGVARGGGTDYELALRLVLFLRDLASFPSPTPNPPTSTRWRRTCLNPKLFSTLQNMW